MERKRYVELALTTAELTALSWILFSAFTRGVRTEILFRDKFRCVRCGNKDRTRLEASHLNHQKDQNYNKAKNGVTHCPCCHLLYHLEHKGDQVGLTESQNDWSVQAIWERLLPDEKEQLLVSYYDELLEVLRDDQLKVAV